MTKVNANDTDLRAFKDAARRLANYLKSQGIELKQAQGLEALTASLGIANWQTLRAKLQEAGQPEVKTLPPNEPRWLVSAIYCDNGQRYGDSYGGDSALEAQIACQLERLSDEGWITEVSIASVVDQLTGQVADEESHPDGAKIVPFMSMLKTLVKLAESNLRPPPANGSPQDAEVYQRSMRAVELWTTIACGASGTVAHIQHELDRMYYHKEEREEWDDENEAVFVDSRGVEGVISASDALAALVDLASQGLDLKDPAANPRRGDVFAVLQGRCTLDYFEDELNRELKGTRLKALA